MADSESVRVSMEFEEDRVGLWVCRRVLISLRIVAAQSGFDERKIISQVPVEGLWSARV